MYGIETRHRRAILASRTLSQRAHPVREDADARPGNTPSALAGGFVGLVIGAAFGVVLAGLNSSEDLLGALGTLVLTTAAGVLSGVFAAALRNLLEPA
ncbi:MAG: hypothetical protein R3C52_11480 [Hyphomonadaceae bacterium]